MSPETRRESGMITASMALLYVNAGLMLLMVICPGFYMIAGVMGMVGGRSVGSSSEQFMVGGLFVGLGIAAAVVLLTLGAANVVLARRLRTASSLVPAMILAYVQSMLLILFCLPACIPSLVAGILLTVEMGTNTDGAQPAATGDQQSYDRHDI